MQKIFSRATLDRIPLYYRALKVLNDSGEKIISSSKLAKILEITPEQIRKDFSDFGQFGIKGVGYNVDKLKRGIEKILGLQYKWKMAIVGVGHLGTALANDKIFPLQGFQVSALFDIDENLIGKKINGVKVYDFAKLDAVIRRKIIDIGIITVPDTQAQIVADALIGAGVKGIWNFAPTKISVPPEIHLVNEDLFIGLTTLSHHLANE
ncbi:MAG: redox-sensing transcriptional repressor Rex [Selenomonadaceae bacterium]|nr:redox-sensing transcriptional repressor Rex [Selenomonadaceae bacterium]